MQPAMKNLMTRLTACSSPEEGTAILVQGIAGAIKRAGTDETKLANLHDDLKTNANAWAGAQMANVGEAPADIANDATAAASTPPAAATKASKASSYGGIKAAREAHNGAGTNGAAAAPAGTPQPRATAKATKAVAATAAKQVAEHAKGRARKAA